MKKYTVKYSRLAKQDITDIYKYLFERIDEHLAKRIVGDIRKEAGLLKTFPESGQLMVRKDNIRYTTARKYKIIYRVRKNDDAVIILRVFHSKRDINISDADDEIW